MKFVAIDGDTCTRLYTRLDAYERQTKERLTYIKYDSPARAAPAVIVWNRPDQYQLKTYTFGISAVTAHINLSPYRV